MKRVADEKFDHDLSRLELGAEAAKTGFVFVGRCAESELSTEVLREPPLQPDHNLVADLILRWLEAVGLPKLVFRQALHADKKAALAPFFARPLFDQGIDCLPSAQVEVTDAEIGSIRDVECLSQRWQKRLRDVVKYPWHRLMLACASALSGWLCSRGVLPRCLC